MDGGSALRLMQRAFASDPGDDSARVPWSLAPRKSKTGKKRSSLLERTSGAAGSAFALAPSTLKLARAALLENSDPAVPGAAHHVQRSDRRCAAGGRAVLVVGAHQAVKEAAGVTVNDVVSGHVVRSAARLSPRPERFHRMTR